MGKRDEKGRFLSTLSAEPTLPPRKVVVQSRRTADGKNMIIGLEGFLSLNEIRALGAEVFRLWSASDHRMYAAKTGGLVEVIITVAIGYDEWQSVYPGHTLSDEELDTLISNMRLCEQILSRIISDVKQAESAEVSTIVI